MPTLYIVATPIGNLEDISLRALRVLKEVDFIICEDTRVTSKLLARYEIQKTLINYFQHSRISRVEEIMTRLGRGESAALVTDAGTPGISDPGGILVKTLTSKLPSLEVSPIPGPCAAIAALSISGLSADSFLFLGFPPHKKGRQKFWKQVVESEKTVVFYESPHRILKSLEQLGDALISLSPQSAPAESGGSRENFSPSKKDKVVQGASLPPRGEDKSDFFIRDGRDEGRLIVVCRELTKMFESVYRGTIKQVIEKVQNSPLKGEYAVVVGK